MGTVNPLVLDSATHSDSCVIWLHGLGADCYDFLSVAQQLQTNLPSTRFILPQAPTQTVTLNGGAAMPSWYDILTLNPASPSRTINQQQLEKSAASIAQLIQTQMQQGIAAKRIILAGFSQGGAVALHTAFLHDATVIGGVLALSTYAPTFTPETPLHPNKRTISVYCLHGSLDEVVIPSMGRAAYSFLLEQQVNALWKEYPMQHSV